MFRQTKTFRKTNMRRPITIAALVLAHAAAMTAASPLLAKPNKGKFLGPGTYAMKNGGCEKLTKIADGGPRNVETTPETLTVDGFSSWETGCGFTSIKEVEKGRKWVAKMSCNDEAGDESPETDTFEKQPDGSFKVTNEDKTTIWVRCDAAKGK